MAVLKDLGLIRANEENTRLHEHVPATIVRERWPWCAWVKTVDGSASQVR
jgi:hypothetical protein